MAKKIKGVRYIAQTLTKTYKKEYPRYTDALPEARRVLAQLQDDGINVNKKNIRGIIRPPKPKLKGAPKLPSGMLSSIDYFNLDTYIDFIGSTPKNIYFTSNIFPSTVKQPLQGGKTYSYEELFQPFVNYFNTIQSNTTNNGDGRYTPSSDWVHVQTQLPQKKGGKWIAKIVFDTNLNIDYGWNPSAPNETPSEDVVVDKQPTTKKEPKQKKQTPPSPKEPTFDIEKEKIASAERIRMAEIELEKKKAEIEAAKDLLKAKAITLAEYKELIK